MVAEKDWTTKLITALMSQVSNYISVAYIGKITKLSPPDADLQPLALLAGKKQNIVTKVRFLTMPLKFTDSHDDTSGKGKLDYEVGDNVLAIVLDDDDMYFTNKDTFKVDSERKHEVDFSIAVAKIATASDFKGGG